MPGTLEGVRVIDFGQYIAGPTAAVMLSDNGADVIHVDPPGGPLWDIDADAFFNRGKRRISLDLKTPEGLDIAKRLIASADVVIEGFRPGVMDRLGVGADAMTAADPRLIYCSIPGFAAEDPRGNVPGWEGVIDAATENCRPRVGDGPPDWDDSRPTYSAIPMASSFGALLSASAIVMALVARERNGKGQRIDVPLFNAMFTVIGPAAAFRNDRGYKPPTPIDPNGSGVYECKDGRWVQFDPSVHRFLTWLAEAAGFSDWGELLDQKNLKNRAVNDELHARLREKFKERTAREWELLGSEAGAAIAFCRTPREWMQEPHARSMEAVTEVNDPILGPTWMTGLAVVLSESNGKVQGPRHLPDQDHAEIVAELDRLPKKEVEPAPEPDVTAPLEGLKVIDLCQVLAGPTGGRLMLEYGADVIKINGPKKGIASHGYLNRGKKSILLDVESFEGQQIFWELVKDADIVTQNFPKGTAERYGIGYSQVKARNPNVIYTSVSCYGHNGPWGMWRGYERQGQAVAGIMERADVEPAVIGPYNLVDIGTGVLSSFATGLAVLYRLKTGKGQHVQATLAQTSTYHQVPYMLDYKGKEWNEARGWAALGEGALQRFYQGQDGKWFFMGAREDQVAALAEATGLESPNLQGAALETALEARFAERPADEWVDRLNKAGLGAHARIDIAGLMHDPVVKAQGLSIEQVTDEGVAVTMPGLSTKMSVTPMKVGKPSRRAGADGPEVLEAHGLKDQIEKVEEAWALQTTKLPAVW